LSGVSSDLLSKDFHEFSEELVVKSSSTIASSAR
jgi:hypothetical protein